MKLVVVNGHDHWQTEDGRLLPAIAGGGTGMEVIAVVAVVATVASTAVSAYAMYEQGQQQKKAAKAQAEMLDQQATMAKNAADARARDIRERNRRILATARANAGASGIALTAGTSPLAVLAYDAKEGELEALRAQYGGDVEAAGLSAQARMTRFAGKNAEYAANIGAGTTLISGLASASGGAYNIYRPGGGATVSAGRTEGAYQSYRAGERARY
jgi:Tfp pilus assembly protein PilE